MRRGALEADAAIVSTAAHTLKGSSGYLGAARLAELCKTLEEAPPSEFDRLITAIEQALDDFGAAIRRELAEDR